MLHHMHLNKSPFKRIKQGTQRIESRIYDEKRRRISVGDEIQFVSRANPEESFKARVVELIIKQNFSSLYDTNFPELFGGSTREELMRIYEYYTPEEEKEWGVVGIKIELILNAKDLLELANNRMHQALVSYYIWKWTSQAVNVNKEGIEKAQENLDEVINKYKNFFIQSFVNAYRCFVLDLAAFFDKNYPEVFNLKKLIKAVNEESGMDKESLDNIERLKEKNSKTISLVMELRKHVAHATYESLRAKRFLKYEEMECLFDTIQKILNIMSKNFDRSVHFWDHVEDEVSRDINWIFGNLKKGEIQRIKEIEQKYQVELSQVENSK